MYRTTLFEGDVTFGVSITGRSSNKVAAMIHTTTTGLTNVLAKTLTPVEGHNFYRGDFDRTTDRTDYFFTYNLDDGEHFWAKLPDNDLPRHLVRSVSGGARVVAIADESEKDDLRDIASEVATTTVAAESVLRSVFETADPDNPVVVYIEDATVLIRRRLTKKTDPRVRVASTSGRGLLEVLLDSDPTKTGVYVIVRVTEAENRTAEKLVYDSYLGKDAHIMSYGYGDWLHQPGHAAPFQVELYGEYEQFDKNDHNYQPIVKSPGEKRIMAEHTLKLWATQIWGQIFHDRGESDNPRDVIRKWNFPGSIDEYQMQILAGTEVEYPVDAETGLAVQGPREVYQVILATSPMFSWEEIDAL